MTTFNAVMSAIFDVLLAPFGHGPAWFDLLLWPVVAGVLALVVYKHLSNQAGITRAKNKIQANLYEVRLFRHDPLAVLAATGRILARNAVYIGYNLVPMVVLLVPMLVVLTQLVANYAFAPAPVGTTELLRVELADDAPISPRDLSLDLPPGVVLDAPPVRTAEGEVFWRIKAEAPGDHKLTLHAGSETLTKGWAVGGEPRKVPYKRTQDWLDAFLYPNEAPLPGDSAVHTLEIAVPERELDWLPSGEFGILVTFFGLSLVAGFALKDVFGVTL